MLTRGAEKNSVRVRAVLLLVRVARQLAVAAPCESSVSAKASSKSKGWRERLSLRSTPAGRGVFARRQFRRGQSIGRMTGRVTTGDDYDPSYVVDLGKAGVLEPAAPFRFLNHCCEPNCELQEWEPEEGEEPQIWVHALKTVRPDQQLTIDYGWPAEAAIPCLCGSPRCRGWVVDEAELPKVLRRQRRKRA